jgi:hypothetical protein
MSYLKAQVPELLWISTSIIGFAHKLCLPEESHGCVGYRYTRRKGHAGLPDKGDHEQRKKKKKAKKGKRQNETLRSWLFIRLGYH